MVTAPILEAKGDVATLQTATGFSGVLVGFALLAAAWGMARDFASPTSRPGPAGCLGFPRHRPGPAHRPLDRGRRAAQLARTTADAALEWTADETT